MKVRKWLHARSKDVGVALLAGMFFIFVLQIFMRYLAHNPLGWTLEVSLLLYSWLVFWFSGFLIKDEEQVMFDSLYSAVQPRTRRVFEIITGTVIVLIFAISYPATIDFVTFMKIEKTSLSQIRLDFVFSIYLLFLTSVIIRGGIRFFRLTFGGPSDTDKKKEEIEP